MSPRNGAPSAQDCAAEISIDELLAKRKELMAVGQRCYVSRVHLAFIDRALAAKS